VQDPSTGLALAWSGGKDCAMALHILRSEIGEDPCLLLCTVGEQDQRIAHHGVPVELLRQQAMALEIDLLEVGIPQHCPNDIYVQRMRRAFASGAMSSIGRIAFGDLYLEDLRRWREDRLLDSGRCAVFPLWQRDTAALAQEVINCGFRALVCAVDSTRLDRSLAGLQYDEAFVRSLPSAVDPCGENGEFHTFVYDGPTFREPVGWSILGSEPCDGLERCLLAPADGD
jgi:uncharacterized protein (TIGR00290 family)